MTLNVDGVEYLTANEVLTAIGVTRQTFHRWRKDGKVPAGHKYRNQVVFTQADFDLVREFANRVEPVDLNSTAQLALFPTNSNSRRE